jgi:hypothetical protein
VNHLVFPDRVTFNVQLWSPSETKPYRGLPLAFHVRTFARAMNDYDLRPFFCAQDGVLTITRRELELAAATELSSGLMDFDAVGNAFPFVEIVHWSGDEWDGTRPERTYTCTVSLARSD